MVNWIIERSPQRQHRTKIQVKTKIFVLYNCCLYLLVVLNFCCGKIDDVAIAFYA
ncbi:hypothetical protein ACE1CI_14825 [Aerosakkonemataceae cyanobacterium BLCC-F50]|uniref:Uncharacterized protein n=1 Tax=Floridaenema flaviceps BLCC-F50 TaxID=3153642 RepID=A0ABV4XSX2_9CYAN